MNYTTIFADYSPSLHTISTTAGYNMPIAACRGWARRTREFLSPCIITCERPGPGILEGVVKHGAPAGC
jgi:hypothetical protein